MSLDYGHPIRQVVGGARGKILEAIIRTHNTYPVRQWARRADVSHVQAGTLLREFADMGIVRGEQRGRNIEYTPVPEHLVYRRLSAVDTVAKDVIPTARALLDAPEHAVAGVFGSAAREALGPDSDLDVFVVDGSDGAWVYEWQTALEDRLGLSVNVLSFTPVEWAEAKRAGERIVAEISRDGLLLQGSLP